MTRKMQQGLTLIEIMVALALSTIVIAGIVQVLLSNRQTYNLNTSFLRVQDNGRFALDYITDSVLNAGNYGCLPNASFDLDYIRSGVDKLTDFNVIQSQAVPGISPSADGLVIGSALAQPDTLTLLMVNSVEGGEIVDAVTSNASGKQTIQVVGGSFENNQMLLATNCYVGDFIQVESVETLDSANRQFALIDDQAGVREDFINPGTVVSEIMPVTLMSYTVDSARETLMVTSLDEGTQVLVNGIENIQFQYGIDTNNDGTPNYYGDITQIIANGELDQVRSVRIFVLAVSGTPEQPGRVLTQDQTLTFAGQEVTWNDRRVREIFESTVYLRNQVN